MTEFKSMKIYFVKKSKKIEQILFSISMKRNEDLISCFVEET